MSHVVLERWARIFCTRVLYVPLPNRDERFSSVFCRRKIRIPEDPNLPLKKRNVSWKKQNKKAAGCNGSAGAHKTY